MLRVGSKATLGPIEGGVGATENVEFCHIEDVELSGVKTRPLGDAKEFEVP